MSIRPPASGAASTFAASGLAGATLASRYVGATASGAPTSGTFAVGDYVIDRTGQIWVCTTAGTPGTWGLVGSGLELASAELSANPSDLTTSVADVTGLTVTFVAPSRAFVVEAYVPRISVVTAGAYVTMGLYDSANTALAVTLAAPVTAGYSLAPILLRSRLPRTGTGAYAITPGNSYTFKVRAVVSADTATIHTDTGTSRPQLSAVTV